VKAVRKIAPKPGISVDELEPPSLDDTRNVLVEVHAAGICGSDLHLDDWMTGYGWVTSSLPITIGHEFAGRVVAIGDGVRQVLVGDRITVMPIVGCRTCDACRDEREEDCAAKKSIGFTLNGGLARYVAVPATNCLKLPANLDLEIAALTEPLSVAAHALRRAEFSAGEIALVLGPGTIGQAIGLLALKAGASKVILVGKGDEKRLRRAKELGIDDTVDMEEQELSSAVASIAKGKVDKVFEATGVPSSIDVGLSVLRREGIFVAAGIHPGPATIDITRLVREKQQLRGTINHSRQDWLSILSILSTSGEDFRSMITHRLDLESAEEAFDLAHKRIASKVLLFPSSG
jgi:L-iditol 2-dehydrogenase